MKSWIGLSTDNVRPMWMKTAEGMVLGMTLLAVLSACSEREEDGKTEGGRVVNGKPVQSYTVESTSKTVNPDSSPSSSSITGIEQRGEAPKQISYREFEQISEVAESNTEQIKTLMQTIQQMQQRLNSTIQAAEQKQVALENFQARLTAYQQEKRDHSKTNQSTQIKKPKKKLSRYPRFQVASIDQWGDDISVVVRYKNQTYDLKLGQAFGSWTPNSVDIDKQTVTFKNRYGYVRELPVKN